MTFLDFFAGVGGFRTGMEQCGHVCLGFCECDKFAIASYVSMHCITDEQREYLKTLDFKTRQKEILKDEYRNGEWFADDIRGLDSGDIPVADCWCFGFPCQDISVAGKQAGFSGNRSSLFFAVTGLIRNIEPECRPKYLFIENVKNLLSINRGFDFARLLIELDDIGYDTEWQVLNSKDFGVPQNRERVFIIGHLRGTSTTKVFPVERTSGENSIHQIGKLGETNRDNPNRHRVYDVDGLAPTICKMDGGGLEPNVAQFCDLNYGDGLNTTENSRTIQAKYGIKNHSGEASGVVMNVEPIGSANWHVSESYQHGIMEDVSGTITACPNNAVAFEVKSVRDDFSTNQYTNEEQTDCDCEDVEITEDLVLDGNNFNQKNVVHGNGSVSRTIIGSGHAGNEPKVAIPVLTPDRENKRQNGRRFKENGDDMFTLTGQDRHGVGVEVEVEPDRKVYTKVSNPTEVKGIRGGLQEHQKDRTDDISPTLTSAMGEGGGQTPVLSLEVDTNSDNIDNDSEDKKEPIYIQFDNGVTACAIWYEKYSCYITIRKLTPRECFRLQGWSDEYYDRASFVNSDSQLYKQAGNGVTVNVIYAIAKNMNIGEEQNE